MTRHLHRGPIIYLKTDGKTGIRRAERVKLRDTMRVKEERVERTNERTKRDTTVFVRFINGFVAATFVNENDDYRKKKTLLTIA